MATRLTTDFHDAEAAAEAGAEFDKVFADGGLPEEIPHHAIEGPMVVPRILAQTGLAASNNEARRLVQQGAVTIDGERSSDPFAELTARQEPYVFKVGKRRFAKIQIS